MDINFQKILKNAKFHIIKYFYPLVLFRAQNMISYHKSSKRVKVSDTGYSFFFFFNNYNITENCRINKYLILNES